MDDRPEPAAESSRSSGSSGPTEPLILLVGEHGARLAELAGALAAAGRVVEATASRERARDVLEDGLVDFVIIDGAASDAEARAFTAVVRALHPHLPIHQGPPADPDALRARADGWAEDFARTRRPRRASKNVGHDVRVALAGAGPMEFRVFAPFNQGSTGIFHCGPRVSPWERHLTTDEFLHVLEGEVDITVLGPDGPIVSTVRAGSAIVVQRGLWHRHEVRERLVELYVTPGGTEHSDAEDPTK